MPAGEDFQADMGAAYEAAGVVGVWKYRAEDRMVFCDRSMAHFFGVDPKLASNGVPLRVLRSVINPIDVPDADANLDHAVQTGYRYDAIYRVGSKLVRSSGAPRREWRDGVVLHGVNFLAGSSRHAPLDRLTDHAIEAVALARQDGDPLTVHFSKMLLTHLGQRQASDLIRRPGGLAQ